jgi:hypothetical protein
MFSIFRPVPGWRSIRFFIGRYCILSVSFSQLDNGVMTVQPMKGTAEEECREDEEIATLQRDEKAEKIRSWIFAK